LQRHKNALVRIFSGFFFICFYRLSNFKAAAVLGSAFLIILLGNILRASALFYIEAEIIKTPAFMHEAVGVFAFAFTAIGIVFAAQFWSNLPTRAWTRFRQNMIAPNAGIQRVMSAKIRIFIILFLAGCFTAFFASHWLPGEKSIKPAVQSSNVFPATFEGFEIKKLPLSERESYFLEDFPGHIGRFSDGKREIIIRYVWEATRKLHPASDCFRATGYSTKPLPLRLMRKENAGVVLLPLKPVKSYVFAREFTTSRAMNGQTFRPGIGQHLASQTANGGR
jgi:exosortase/archaeosortase family protein